MSLRNQLRVMVVDDSRTSRGLITNALTEMGIQNFTWEASAGDALQSLAKKPVHLVISDYNMPNRTGLELLSSVREHPRLSKTGFIMITGSPDQRILETGRKLGLNNFIKKPFSTGQLKHCIERVTGPI